MWQEQQWLYDVNELFFLLEVDSIILLGACCMFFLGLVFIGEEQGG
jgi:hypothetical protein